MMANKINYIQQVDISGLWQRYDILWNLNPDVNILAGINGSGKSTILDCICSLVSIGTIHDFHLRKLKGIKIYFDNKKYINYEYIKIKDSIKNIEEKANKGDSRCQEIISNIKDHKGNDYKKIRSIEIERHETSFQDLMMSLGELNKSINIDIISTFDNSLKEYEAVKKLSDDNVTTDLDWNIYHLQKKYLDYQLNISKRKDSIINESTENIQDEFKKIIYPQTKFIEIIDRLFYDTGKEINKNKNEVEFLLGDKEITPFQLSSGEKQLLIILLTVLIQDNKPYILFMDEPEISLHVEWQKKIIKYIRELNPNVQIIIATHSPAIIMEGWQDKVFEVSDLIVKDNQKS